MIPGPVKKENITDRMTVPHKRCPELADNRDVHTMIPSPVYAQPIHSHIGEPITIEERFRASLRLKECVEGEDGSLRFLIRPRGVRRKYRKLGDRHATNVRSASKCVSFAHPFGSESQTLFKRIRIPVI